MKNIKYCILGISSAFIISSCDNSFLELYPETSISAETFF